MQLGDPLRAKDDGRLRSPRKSVQENVKVKEGFAFFFKIKILLSGISTTEKQQQFLISCHLPHLVYPQVRKTLLYGSQSGKRNRDSAFPLIQIVREEVFKVSYHLHSEKVQHWNYTWQREGERLHVVCKPGPYTFSKHTSIAAVSSRLPVRRCSASDQVNGDK